MLNPRPLLRTLENRARLALGLDVRLRTEDRRLLEQVILPEYARRDDVRTILFVGCAPCTRDYGEHFAGRDYRTLDPDPRKRRFGAGRHMVAALQDLDVKAPAGIFDLIVCNGVLGWGLDARSDIERAFTACHAALRPGGELVLGWNDVAPRNRIPPDRVEALGRFRQATFRPLGAHRYRADTDNRHTYDFYAR